MAERARIRVATFNLHRCEGADGVVDVSRSIAAIAATEADVIALQEIDRGLPRSGSIDQVAEIERATGLHVHFRATVRRAGGEYGIGLATSDPIDVVATDLPGGGDSEPRAALIASIDVAGTRVAVIATHLAQGRHRTIQELQLARLAELVSARPGLVVLMGDLNRRPGELDVLGAAGLRAAVEAPTFPARKPRRQLDHILVSEGVYVVGGGSIATDASDHLPLWVALGTSN
ncbi:MAG: hypothetical protein QOF16_1414 [Actinomycetota bacterium]|nr:hypothetical protein [Actinomycetota bacterium]